MADTTDLVFKKIVGRQYTTEDKSWYEEQPGPPFKLHADDVWIEDIPLTPPSSGTSSIVIFNTLTLTKDITVADEKSWLAENPLGTRIGEFIPPRYGQGYSVRIYDSDSDEIPTTDPVNWFFDYDYGVLTFENDPGNYGWNDSSFKIKAYRYVGLTVNNIVTSGTITASDVINDSTVSGVTVKDALEFLSTGGNLDVSRFVFNQHLTTVSGLTIFSIPDPPVSGTVQVYTNGLLQEPGGGKDYMISGNIIMFASETDPGDILLASYIKEL
jgi:hypothetical protein